jgi:hypothetical protein
LRRLYLKNRILLSFLTVLTLALPASALAQGVSLGADIVSRYNWRGYDFGESLSIQPALTFSNSGFEIGTWASYSISANGAEANEHDIWLGYTIESVSSGSFSFGLTDYYFPSPGGMGFFEFDGDGDGSHWLEPYVNYTGPESFPISLYGAVFVHNDPDNSGYVQLSFPFMAEDVELGFVLGAVTNESSFYGTDGFAIVNLGLSAAKSIPITDAFALPISMTMKLKSTTNDL